VEASWSDDVRELEKCRSQMEEIRQRQLELMIHADNERKQVSHVHGHSERDREVHDPLPIAEKNLCHNLLIFLKFCKDAY